MRIKLRIMIRALLVVVLFPVILSHTAEAKVKKEGERIFIVDKTGERWDITEAVSIGFDPYRFEFGIGRNAFRPLSETDWYLGSDSTPSNLRIIGIAEEGDANAYSVNRLQPIILHHSFGNRKALRFDLQKK